MTQRSMHDEIGQRYEAREMLNRYKADPALLVDDLHRLENLWVNVTPNAQFSPKYDRGFIARTFGPGSPYGQGGLGVAGGDSPLYASIAIGVKAGLQVRPEGAAVVSVISDLVDLDAAQRKKWGSHILSASPDLAATTAMTLAQMRGVMDDIAKTYPDAPVRDGAKRFLEERLLTLRDRGVTPGEEATATQLKSAFGAQAPPPGFTEAMDALKAQHPQGLTQQQLHEALDEWGNLFGEKLKADNDALRNDLKPLLEEADKKRRDKEWEAYELEVQNAQAWVSLCSTALTAVGAPPGAIRLCQIASAGITLVRAITLLTRDYSTPPGTINPVALASGAGAALTMVSLVSAASADPDPTSEMLKQIMAQLDDLAKQLHEVHKLVGELFSFAISMRSEMAETLATIRSDIQGLVSLYVDTERAKLISALHVYAAPAELAGATQQEVESRLAELATRAITEGSTELQTHGGPVYAGQFETVARALLTGTHAESFIGLLFDALGDLCFRLQLCSTSWPHRPPQEGPESERFDEMVPPGRVIAPLPLVNALTLFRRVATAHPSHVDRLPANGVTSITHYRRLVRAAAWMQMLLVAARAEEVLVSGVVRQQVALAGLVQQLSAIYRGFMNGRGDEARALPVETLFGLQTHVDSDWVVNSLRTLRTLHQLGSLGDPRIDFGPGWAYVHVTWSIGPQPVVRVQIDVREGYRDEFVKKGTWGKAARHIAMEADLAGDRNTISAWVSALLNNIFYLGPITWYGSGATETSTDWQLSSPPPAVGGVVPPHGIAAVPDGTGAFVAMKAREWAQAAIAAQVGTPGAEALRNKAQELARATLQCCALLKNHRPGVRPGQLPFSLARLVTQSEDFAIFSDVTRLFYGPELPAFFPVHERTAYRLPPTGAQDLWRYPLEPLVAHASMFDNAPERAAQLAELRKQIRAAPGFAAFAQQLPPQGETADGVAQPFASSRSVSCRGLLEQEMQFQIALVDPLRELLRWAAADTIGVEFASTFVAHDIRAETDLQWRENPLLFNPRERPVLWFADAWNPAAGD